MPTPAPQQHRAPSIRIELIASVPDFVTTFSCICLKPNTASGFEPFVRLARISINILRPKNNRNMPTNPSVMVTAMYFTLIHEYPLIP